MSSTPAGRSARAQFGRLRRENLQREWRGWLAFAGMAFAGALMIVFLKGVLQMVGAWSLGFISAIVLVGWMIGFDVHTLPWVWGALGEEATADELAKLGPEWHVTHDVVTPYGNWDHVLVGPPGVYLLDSKNLSGQVVARQDGLSSGRIQLPASGFRGAAYGLSEKLKQRLGWSSWVQAVVVVWGDFSQGVVEGDRVFFVAGDQVTAWLQAQNVRLPAWRVEKIARELSSLGAPSG